MDNNVELKEKRSLVDECLKGISKKQIEEFFGIKVLLDSSEDDKFNKYNIYMGDKLIFGKMASWDVEQILEVFSQRCASLLCNSAEKDKDSEAGRKKAEQLKEKELEYERNNYVRCPICGITYDSSCEVHFHYR